MYTSYIGKKFLKLYRDKYNKPDDYTAQQFFDEEFFPLFFRDDSHLMHVGNSPFFQKPSDEDISKHGSKLLAQLDNFRKKIDNRIISGTIYVGFAAEEIQATTSGQLSSIDFGVDDEEIYSSWIGEALAIGVSGGCILIDEDDVLLTLFNGWKHYRRYYEQTPNLKDKQIETWNGQWLNLSLNNTIVNEDVEYSKIEATEVVGNLAIPTIEWSAIVFALSKKYGNKTLTAYAYSLSKVNTTFGFINIYLKEINYLYELRDAIFIKKSETILADKELEQLETFFSFKSACKIGTIGIKAMEPSGLREFMPKGSVDYAQGKDFKFNNENSYINYQLYKLWIIAMLNKTELLQLASQVAKALLEFEDVPDNRGKKDLETLSKEVQNAKNLKAFIDGLTDLLSKKTGNEEMYHKVVEQILTLPADVFPLFTTLIRFEYAYQKSNSNQ